MNKKKLIITVLLIGLLLSTGLIIFLGSGKETQETIDYSETETVHATNSIATLEENETSIKETYTVEKEPAKETTEPEYIVVESTPDFVKIEILGEEKKKTVHVQFGAVTDAGMYDGEEAQMGTQSQATKPTEPAPTQPKPTEPKSTEPKPTEPAPAEPKPIQPSTGGTKVEAPGTGVTFAEYEAMSGQEQMLFYYTFADAEAFNAWYDVAKAAYDAGKNEIIVGEDGVVNLG